MCYKTGQFYLLLTGRLCHRRLTGNMHRKGRGAIGNRDRQQAATRVVPNGLDSPAAGTECSRETAVPDSFHFSRTGLLAMVSR